MEKGREKLNCEGKKLDNKYIFHMSSIHINVTKVDEYIFLSVCMLDLRAIYMGHGRLVKEDNCQMTLINVARFCQIFRCPTKSTKEVNQ